MKPSKLIAISALFLFFLTSCVASCVIGGISADSEQYNNRVTRESITIRERILSDQRFSKLRVERTSIGVACLAGQLETPDERKELENKVIQSFGDHDIFDRMSGVGIKRNQ